ncbi:MAG: CopG family ribbon-helix-helix protein [Candidatus Anammoxibacter sp.]
MIKTLTIRLPDDLRNDLHDISKQEDKPVSDLVKESLRKFVNVKKFRKIREKALPLAESQGYLTDEDIFEVVS